MIAVEDIRGTNYNDILYITEVQNYDVDMLKTVLERMEIEDGNERGRIILDGDKRQIDTPYAEGSNCGITVCLKYFKVLDTLGM